MNLKPKIIRIKSGAAKGQISIQWLSGKNASTFPTIYSNEEILDLGIEIRDFFAKEMKKTRGL
jgi:hypothetical protein